MISLAFSIDPSAETSDSRLGLSGNAPFIDLHKLASDVVLTAGSDITFGIDLNMIQGTAALVIETWGAFAEIIADPIELSIPLFERDLVIRDSHFATSAELRSRGKFIASLGDLLGDSAVDTSMLIPDLTVPLSTEFIFDVPVTEEIVLTPIMSAESENVIGSEFSFFFDVDLDTFMNNQYVGVDMFQDFLHTANQFLEEVASFQLELNLQGDVAEVLDGFFTIVNQLGDLSEELAEYIDMVAQGASGRDVIAVSYFNIPDSSSHDLQCKA